MAGCQPVGHVKPHAYFELHIEQGPILEQNDMLIGVVKEGKELHGLKYSLLEKSHTPDQHLCKCDVMLVWAQRIIILVNDIAVNIYPTR